ncbi:cell division protein FtsQ/DivIB [Neptuniibacter sp. QD37_11]|uniref:cell division protein FtsQ/DivIB n=1 Tax=Neptuniibacter sp. QD37_11 TaxID=3398209 RepID=UPI0039F624F8
MNLLRFFRQTEPLGEQEVELAKPRGASREKIAKEEPVKGKADKKNPKKDSLVNNDTEFWWKPFWTLSSLVIFIGVLWGIGHNLWQWLDRPVASVVIEGKTQHLDREKLGQIIAGDLTANLLEIDIESVQSLVSEQPWVRVSSIRRDWPDTLLIEVEEEVPVARWGERGLLNHQGDIFWPELSQEYRSLPRLSGPAPDTERVMSQFHDFNQMLKPMGLSVVALDLEARGAWTMELDNQIKVVVGREAINARLQRFLTLYKQRLAAQAADIETIDIRYTHGVAVKWREKPESEMQDKT